MPFGLEWLIDWEKEREKKGDQSVSFEMQNKQRNCVTREEPKDPDEEIEREVED